MDEEVHGDMCEGEGGRGGGGSVYEVAPGTCEGGGGGVCGLSMDDASTHTSGFGR